jgi:hypothetical protein
LVDVMTESAPILVDEAELRAVLRLAGAEHHGSDKGAGWGPEDKHLGPRCSRCGEFWPCTARRLWQRITKETT